MQYRLFDPKNDLVVHRTCNFDVVETRMPPEISYVIRGNNSLVLVALEKGKCNCEIAGSNV
jgi:hypothetical protein